MLLLLRRFYYLPLLVVTLAVCLRSHRRICNCVFRSARLAVGVQYMLLVDWSERQASVHYSSVTLWCSALADRFVAVIAPRLPSQPARIFNVYRRNSGGYYTVLELQGNRVGQPL